jgi:hypothetical protein
MRTWKLVVCPAVIAVAVLFSAACGGSGEKAKPTEGPNPPQGAVETAKPNDQQPTEIRQYASALLRIKADGDDKLNEVMASVPDMQTLSAEQWWSEAERLYGEGSILMAEYAGELRALDPPEEFRMLHERFIASAENYQELFQRRLLAAQDRDSAGVARVGADALDLSTELDELNAEFTQMLNQVLE